MRNRVEEIKAKGFNIMQGPIDTETEQYGGYQGQPQLDFNKIKIGAKTLDDAVYKLGDLRKTNPILADKPKVLKAIDSGNLKEMREISDFFYKTSGIYSRILRYMAFLYRYDWMITPYVNDESMKSEKILDAFNKALKALDDFHVKKILGEIALTVLRQGAYYGYKVKTGDGIVLQELPVNYCRSRFNYGEKPAVEFNMRFFDENFQDINQRIKILKLFPEEFAKGYTLYKKGKLPPQFQGDISGWYLLDPEMTVKFNANGEDYPAFISVIPLILDLDAAQELDRKKTMQRLLKIIIQKMPMDKNGDLVFDVDEAQQLHNNVVQMIGKAIGLDVLTTFADVEVADLSDTAVSAQTDDLERVERQLYNEAGVSQMQFNTSGNLALEKSTLNDEATMYNLLLQFEQFLNEIVAQFNKGEKLKFQVQLLTTTIYNYKDLAKLYVDQTKIGYSKMLPQIALGQSQSSILANAYFENNILDLVNVFIPPMSSNTMNAEALGSVTSKGKTGTASGSDSAGGRPTNESQGKEVSEKTIQNKESAS